MVVIHPKDKTTSMLSVLYEGLEHTYIDQSNSKKDICHILNHVPRHERIYLLGHGSDKGLFLERMTTIMISTGLWYIILMLIICVSMAAIL